MLLFCTDLTLHSLVITAFRSASGKANLAMLRNKMLAKRIFLGVQIEEFWIFADQLSCVHHTNVRVRRDHE